MTRRQDKEFLDWLLETYQDIKTANPLILTGMTLHGICRYAPHRVIPAEPANAHKFIWRRVTIPHEIYGVCPLPIHGPAYDVSRYRTIIEGYAPLKARMMFNGEV